MSPTDTETPKDSGADSIIHSDVAEEEQVQPGDVHLVLLLHGLYGSPQNLWCCEEEVVAAHAKLASHHSTTTVPAAAAARSGDGHSAAPASSTNCSSEPLQLVVLNAKSYEHGRTRDGIDVNAHRVGDELDAEIERLAAQSRRVVAISITGYSLGGLIARALVGQLHARTPSFFDACTPAAFATIATPHLGVLRYGSWRSTWLHAVGQHMFSRTGQQLYCQDTDHGSPLLAVMSHPDRVYMRALSLFPSVTIFANGVNDLTVPYPTAAICEHDPFVDYEARSLQVELDGRVVREYYSPDVDADEVETLVAPSRAPTPIPGARIERPWLPPVFYLNRPGPLRYALFPLLPLIIPMILSLVCLTFAYHSFQSAQRIRLHNSSMTKRPLLLKVDDDYKYDYGSTDQTPTATPQETPIGSPGTTRPSSPPSRADVVDANGVPRPHSAATNAAPGTQPVLTALQRSMIQHLSALPQLERVVAWFPLAFNAHAVIVARNARLPKWTWQGEGRQVVRVWADRIVTAGNAAVAVAAVST